MTSSSGSTNNSLDITGLQDISEGQVNLGNQLISQGGSIYNPAYAQYMAGVSGQLTPAQQSLVTENLGSMNTKTEGTYGDLGLGGSTMESQDLAGNSLRSEAETANLLAQSETLGLSGLQTAMNYYTGAGQDYSGAATSAYDAGNLSNANLTALNNAISSLGGKSSTGGGLSSLLSSAGGAAGGSSLLSSLGGSAAGGSVASAGTDIIPVATGLAVA